MALIVQTASGVSGANSYNSLQDARGIALLNGWTLSTEDVDLEADLRSGMIYIESRTFRGTRLTTDLSFPRAGIYRDGFLVPPIPDEVLTAHVRLASYAARGSILPERSRIKKFRLEGVYSQEVQDPDALRKFQDVEALLHSLTYSGRLVVGRL